VVVSERNQLRDTALTASCRN